MKTFWRLLGFLRPYRSGVIVSFALAAAAMGVGVLIPYLVGRTVDEIGNGGDNLWPLAATVAAAGVLRLAFSVNRRIVAGRVSLGVEYDLRNRIYGHLNSLELAFFDGQQTGQLMSRSTVDLQAVRFFLGYGLIFIVQSLLTIVIAAGVMFVVDPRLAAVALAPMPFVIWVAFRYGRLNRPATQEVQQRIAELTAEAEENVGGIRVVKAFAQEERQVRRFNHAVARVFDQSMVSTRLRAFYSPLLGFIPQLGLAGLLFVGGHQAINGSLEVGQFVAFYGYVLMLTAPMRMLGMALGMAQRAVASGARVFELLDRDAQLTVPAEPRALPDGGGRVELRDVTFGYGDDRAVLRHVDLDVEAGRTVALVGPTGSGKTQPRDARAAPVRRAARAPCWWTAWTSATSTPPCCGARWRWCPTTPSSSPPRSPTTSPTRARTRARTRSGWPRRGRGSTSSSTSSPAASTRSWASAGSRSPAASASAWRSPGRCSPSRAS